MIPGSATPFLLAQSGEDSYKIDRSLRFNSADSAYLGKTFSSAGSTTTWTLSFWIKRAKGGGSKNIFMSYNGSSIAEANYANIEFNSSDQLSVGYAYGAYKKTNRVFRDFSSWYHIVVRLETGNSTASDRVQIYVNGVKETSFASTHDPDSGQSLAWNKAHIHRIGSEYNQFYNDCYFAEIHFVDGTALDADSFGEFDSNNVWQPKKFTGSYGTNGFHLDFSDTSDLGNDKAGSNNWTPNNLVGVPAGLSTANQGFDVVTYTGNHPTGQSITNLNFQPDLVWIKDRSGGNWHYIFDSVRGVEKAVFANATNAENTYSNTLTAFNSNGFTLGSDNATNQSSNNYVAWCWKAGGTAASNSDGSITSSVSTNSTYGFSICTYTGTGSSATVGHGLGAAPKFVIVKRRNSTSDWAVGHDSAGGWNKVLYLNQTASVFTQSEPFNATAPSSTVISLLDSGSTNGSGGTYVAYCWAEVSGFSKFSSYSGSGASGNKQTLGFKPGWVMIKCTTTAGNEWTIFDTKRNPSNPADDYLYANSGNAEASYSNRKIEVLSDGFQFYGSDQAINTNGDTYIYAAFAGTPDQSAIDSLIDTPTEYEAGSGNNGGNYATLNPLNKNNTADTFSEGNLKLTSSGSGAGHFSRSTIAMSSGKYYWEVTWDDTSHNFVGIQGQSDINYNNSYVYLSNAKASATNGSSEGSSYGASWGNGDIIGIAYDADNATLTFYKNGVSQGTAFTSITGTYSPYPSGYVAFFGNWANQACTFNVNFGQRPFAYTPPTGHVSLCTTNLPDPTIADGSAEFKTVLRNGFGTSGGTVTVGFSPGLLWEKTRSTTGSHSLYDAVRGAAKILSSNNSNAETTDTDQVNAFTSTGYTLGTNEWSTSTTLVGWAWNAGSSNTSISVGGLNSSVYSYDNWTSMVTGNYSSAHGWGTTYQTLNAFDGNLSTMVIPHGTDGWKFEPTNAIAGNTIEIYGWNDGCPNAGLKINGNNYGDALGADQTVGQWYTLPYSTLSSIEMAGDGSAGSSEFRLIAIRIDGKILIQNGQSPPNVPAIASTVRANPSAGFSIVSATAPSSNTSFTLGHGLNATPSFIIFRQRTASNWAVYHSGIASAETKYLHLNSSNAVGTATTWNNTAPTSNVFSSTMSGNWDLGADLIAYCFAPVAGYSAFGSYNGNSSTDGPFVYTGFKPAFVIARRSNGAGDWIMHDTTRTPSYGIGDNNTLVANVNNGEDAYYSASQVSVDYLSNGFKIRHSGGPLNDSGFTYIYAAFAENPFKTARAR